MFYYLSMIYGKKRSWERVDVEVLVIHRSDGVLLPVEIHWPDGRRWILELLGDARRGRVEHIGKYAIVYKVNVITPSGRRYKRNLYLDENNRNWFIVRHEFARGRPIIVDQHGIEHFCTIPKRYGKAYCDPEMWRICPIGNNCV